MENTILGFDIKDYSLSENVYVTQSELAEKIGIHRTRINDNMTKLKEMGVIRCIGSE